LKNNKKSTHDSFIAIKGQVILMKNKDYAF